MSGYYFNLTLLDPGTGAEVDPDRQAEVIREFREVSGNAFEALENDGSDRSEWGWAAMDEDLRAFSKGHPGILFRMHVKGVDTYEDFYLYIQDGKGQYCPGQMAYPPFDAGALR